MATTQYRVEAVLSAKDQGFSANMNKARQVAQDLGTGAKKAGEETKGFTQRVVELSSAIGVTALVKKGFDMIAASVGKAMDRQDTMDNFSRSVANMTGDVKLADKALADLTKKVTGTAYGLDTVANSTKGLFTSGLSLEKSTQYIEGWMNAVSQYGDGTNSTLGNVTYQLSQMTTKGKANLGDLKSAMEAGIPVIKIYAEAMGESTEDVSKAISNGQISADQFMEVMDRAFREGTKSFKSIEGASKSAGSTWRGTFDNMKAATTRGVLAIINAIEDGRKKADMGGMKDAVKLFGVVTEKSLKLVANVAGFAAQHIDKLTLSVGTAFTVWGMHTVIMAAKKSFDGLILTTKLLSALQEKNKLITYAQVGALTFKTVAIGVLTGKIGLVTAAQMLWNAVISANPLGLLIVGVTTVVTALAWLNSALNGVSEEHKKHNKEAKDLAETNKDLANSTSELNSEYKKTESEAKANTIQARNLVAQLDKLSRSSMDAKQKQYQMAQVVDELNSKYPELNVQLDETGTAIKGSTEAIYKQIEAMEEQAKMNAMKDYLGDLYKKQFELSGSIDVTKQKLLEMEQAGTNNESTWWGLSSKTSEGYKELTETLTLLEAEQLKVDDAIKISTESIGVLTEAQYNEMLAQEEQMKSLENLYNQYGLTSDAIVQYTEMTGEKLDEAGQSVVALSEQFGVSTDSIIAYVNEQGMTLEGFAKQHEENIGKAQKSLESYVDSATSGFKELKQEATVSLAEYQEQLRKNVEATNQWSTNVNALMRAGVSEGLIKELEKMGPAGALQAQRFVQELEELNGGALGEYDQLNQGTKDKLKELEDLMSDGQKAAYNATKTSLDAQDYYGEGGKIIQDMAEGLVNTRYKLTKESFKSAEQMKNEFKRGANNLPSDARSIGNQTGWGFRDGLNATAGSVYATANTIASNVAGTIRRSLAIRSPSRVTRGLGQDTGEGFALGLSDMLPSISAISHQMADSVSDIDSSLSASTHRFSVSSDSPSVQGQAGLFRFVLGDREYEAYVDDITSKQDKTVRLKLAYEGG